MAVYGYDIVGLVVGFGTVLGFMIYAVKQKKKKTQRTESLK